VGAGKKRGKDKSGSDDSAGGFQNHDVMSGMVVANLQRAGRNAVKLAGCECLWW
jgi:hypothetical protein